MLAGNAFFDSPALFADIFRFEVIVSLLNDDGLSSTRFTSLLADVGI